jgi:hypothetical protein
MTKSPLRTQPNKAKKVAMSDQERRDNILKQLVKDSKKRYS